MKKMKKNENGFTLLEVMVAMIIITVSLLLLLNMSMVALDGNDWANKTTIATQAIQQKMEELRSTPNNLTPGNDSLSGGLIRQWDVVKEGKFLQKVEVVVAWADIKNKRHADTMTAFIRTDSL